MRIMSHASENTVAMTLFEDKVALAFLAHLATKNPQFELFFSFWVTIINPSFVNSYESTPKIIWISL